MLKLSLWLIQFIRKEPCSIQREIMSRVAKKRAVWDLSSEELLFLYDHLDKVIKKRKGIGTIIPGEFFTLLKYPKSTLNFLASLQRKSLVTNRNARTFLSHVHLGIAKFHAVPYTVRPT